jgi:hypothetical protein
MFRAVEGVNGRMSRAGENNGSIDLRHRRNSSTSFSLLIFERFRADHRVVDVFAFAPFQQPWCSSTGSRRPRYRRRWCRAITTPRSALRRARRVFTPEDDRVSATPVAVISFRYWENRFGRDPAVVGKTSRSTGYRRPSSA